jgi:hypothetical protein
MSRESVLARGRTAAEAGMVDGCTVRRLTGSVTDDFSGVPVETWADLYAGKCRVQQDMAQSQAHTVGEDYQLLLRLEVQLPMSVVGLEIGDVVTITSSASDPDLPGRVFLVRDLAHKTDATARRIQVTERTD